MSDLLQLVVALLLMVGFGVSAKIVVFLRQKGHRRPMRDLGKRTPPGKAAMPTDLEAQPKRERIGAERYLSFPTIITSLGWIFAPALGWSVGSLALIPACENLLPSAGRDLCGLATGSLGLLIGVIAASILTPIAIRRILPGIESKQILRLILGWVGGLALGIPVGSFWAAMAIGMGCDLPTASQINSCVRAMLYSGFMVSYVVMGLVGGNTVASVLKRSEQHRREMSKRASEIVFLPMAIASLLLSCGVWSLIPGEETMEIVLSTPLIFWVSGGLALQGVLITRFLVSTCIRIQQAKFDSVSQV